MAQAQGLFDRLSDEELLARALRPGAGSLRLRRVSELKRADAIRRACLQETDEYPPRRKSLTSRFRCSTSQSATA